MWDTIFNLSSVQQLVLLCMLWDGTLNEHRFSIPMIDDDIHKFLNTLSMLFCQNLAAEWLEFIVDVT